MRPKVYITRKIAEEAIEKAKAVADVEVWLEELPPSYEILSEKVKNADGILSMLTDRIDSDLMDMAPNLKVVSNLAVGYDNIDIAEATRRHIPVGNTPGVLTETTADLAFSLLMAASRRIVEADNYTRKGQWKTWGPMILLGQDIHHATLGIVGLGRIGAEVARRAGGFNMRVLYHDEKRRSLDEEKELGIEYCPDVKDLIATSDFISIHVPLLPQTHHLFGEKEFKMMKKTAVLINTSRGPVVDQKALFEALRSGQIFAAGLDVTEVEPISMDDPLLTLDNVIIAPHIGSASFYTRTKMAFMAVENLLAGLRGELPPNCVNPDALKQ